MRSTMWLARISMLSALSMGNAYGAPNFFFYDTFDEGLGSSPVSGTSWTWQKPFSESNATGMMIGKGDIYEISEQIAFKGSASLRLNFDGRNGWCNTCGADSYTVADGIQYSVSLQTDELGAVADQPNANRPIFNKSDSWSRWTPNSVSEKTLFFAGGAPSRNELGGLGVFNEGDEIFVARECGIDGNVGGEPYRRSDCNLAINYLRGVSRTDFEFGESIARRFYIYVPPQTVMPDRTLKLGYTWLESQANGKYHVYPLVSVQRNEKIEVASRSIVGSQSFTGEKLERGVWYYLEEVYTRETSSDANDGTYDLYFDRHDEVTGSPLVSLKGITFGDLLDMSIIGNWQHANDATGFLYIDEVAVADGYIGPVDGELKKAAFPNAPTIISVE